MSDELNVWREARLRLYRSMAASAGRSLSFSNSEADRRGAAEPEGTDVGYVFSRSRGVSGLDSSSTRIIAFLMVASK